MRERERESVCTRMQMKRKGDRVVVVVGKAWRCTVRCAGEERGNVSGMERGRGGCNGYAYV